MKLYLINRFICLEKVKNKYKYKLFNNFIW
nr:MAG TPA: hypothetical protein [Caudoviricetes sp.]